jgi:Bacterial Ig-like domain (group 2)
VPNTSDSCGLATATGIGGPDTITASITLDGQTFTNTAQVSSATGATLTSIDVDPITPSIAPEGTQQFTAEGIFSDGSTHDVTGAVNWVSSNTAAASISTQGLASVPAGAAAGSNTIIAASTQVSGQTVSAIAILTVAGKTLVSVNVTPATASVAVNGTQQFTLTGTYSDNSTQNLTSSAAWSSSDTSIMTVVSGNGCSATPNTSNSCGYATGVAAGGPVTITATITASGQTFNGSAQLSVTTSSPILVSISVTPVSASVAVNGTQQFTATGTYSDNSTQNLTGLATWTSSDTTVATIVSGNGCSATPNTSNSCGFATGIAVGSPVTITASVTVTGQTYTSTASLTVSVLACNPPPNPNGGGSLPYENESYCASFSGVTDMLYTFTGTLTFTTPITPGSIINCEYATSGTWNSQPASTGPTPCTGGIDPYGNLSVTDSLGNTFTGTFSSDGTTVSGSYLFTDFGPGGGVAAGSFSGTEQQ